jgi:hypothetical protein
VVAAGTLYTLVMTTEACETLGLATVPREVTPGLRPAMEIAGVPEDLINWSASRRQRIEDALEVLTDQYVKDHGHLPSERGRHGLGSWAAQETRPAKKKPKPLAQLLAWWRAFAILCFGQQLIDGLLDTCRAAGAAIRARVDSIVDVALAAVDVATVVFTVREKFSRRHILAEARRHLLERAAAVQAHQQAAMPEEYLEGRTTDPATWLRTPKNLDRAAAFTRAADTRRAMEDRKAPAADPASPVDQHRQEHEQQRQQPAPGQGQGLRP